MHIVLGSVGTGGRDRIRPGLGVGGGGLEHRSLELLQASGCFCALGWHSC